MTGVFNSLKLLSLHFYLREKRMTRYTEPLLAFSSIGMQYLSRGTLPSAYVQRSLSVNTIPVYFGHTELLVGIS